MCRRPDCKNKTRDTGHNCHTSNKVAKNLDVGMNTSKAYAHDILLSPVKYTYLIGMYEVYYL
jgi:hypothetical protein